MDQQNHQDVPAPGYVGRVGWIDCEGVPLCHVKVVSLSGEPCKGCGGAAGSILFLEDAEDALTVISQGSVIGPCCLKEIIFEDDPARAAEIVALKARLNSSRI